MPPSPVADLNDSTENLSNDQEIRSSSYHHTRSHTGLTASSSLPKAPWATDPRITGLWNRLQREQLDSSVENIQKAFVRHVTTTLARTNLNLDHFAAYQAVAHTVRDRLIASWNATQQRHTIKDVKRVYYLSLEFLLGRTLDNALLCLGQKEAYAEALSQLGFKVEDLLNEEVDAALGNGGLGRLAACFMDSLATMNIPAWGYGLRYTYGIFQQRIVDGYQHEFPDYWLTFASAWELPRLDVIYEVRFYGNVNKVILPGNSSSNNSSSSSNNFRYNWTGGEVVQAVAYDVPIPGYKTENTINIRLWSSKPRQKFDLQSFNAGLYHKSVEEQQKAENITAVLYPNDNTMQGKELRLKQQYFFVCATLKDVMRRFKKSERPWSDFPLKVAMQLNDTHPTLAIPELMRRLVDIEGLNWDDAWNITKRVFSFTNHTVLPEAMEKWRVPMVQQLLPRHMMIIYDINLFFLQSVEKVYPNDRDRLIRMSIIEEGSPQWVRMAHLAVVGSHTVNGVAAIHSALIRETIFRDFVEFERVAQFQNKTNGITPRRWLLQANPLLATLITRTLGSDAWLKDLKQLQGLKVFAKDAAFQREWKQIKQFNKIRLARYIEMTLGVNVSSEALFDVQVKRIHEYKRQLMNILYVIYRYLELKEMTKLDNSSNESQSHPNQCFISSPRVVLFGGKAAPGYHVAKTIIKLIHAAAEVINNDVTTQRYLKVVFIPDYCVSVAELIIPASDLSQHISTAGTEASGTSNMKFALNGGLLLGTWDGATIEIADEIGRDNVFLFGALAEQVPLLRQQPQCKNVRFERVLQVLRDGLFGDYVALAPAIETLTLGGDFYLLAHDFDSYCEAQTKVDRLYKEHPEQWIQSSILSVAGMGQFSSDRSMQEYARDIWQVVPDV